LRLADDFEGFKGCGRDGIAKGSWCRVSGVVCTVIMVEQVYVGSVDVVVLHNALDVVRWCLQSRLLQETGYKWGTDGQGEYAVPPDVTVSE
jgi:hypothetical protein